MDLAQLRALLSGKKTHLVAIALMLSGVADFGGMGIAEGAFDAGEGAATSQVGIGVGLTTVRMAITKVHALLTTILTRLDQLQPPTSESGQ